jgi:hypothetical protein
MQEGRRRSGTCRPKSALRRVTEHLREPDLDKLIRCVKDGLTRAGVHPRAI